MPPSWYLMWFMCEMRNSVHTIMCKMRNSVHTRPSTRNLKPQVGLNAAGVKAHQ